MYKVIILFLLTLSSFAGERIVSTVPSLSETLYELGLGEEVVGVSSYCLFDKEFCKRPKVGTSLDFSYEKILKYGGKTVLLSKNTNKTQLSNLQKLNIEIILLKHDRLLDIYDSIQSLGKRFKKEERAKEMLDLLDKSFQEEFLKSKKRNVLFLISTEVRDGKIVKIQAVGAKNFYTDIMDRIGLNNILKESTVSFPELGREKLLSLDYDYIIEIFGSHNKDSLNKKKSAWNDLLKYREKKFEYIPLVGDYLYIPGPSVWKTAKEIKKSLGRK
ncbi:helical backbone metal receptor [Halobacteriovorax sp. JY17]|uniref:ABC transporter substrate-binding protein n=1 Tax=Halobacteriovorax sp. JY17 TaxID=2014617 RepID=UPI000C442D30|nr:helical backbone metal receptor [Halobacteriovorax sp. JY17]PIK14628.1 MAG: hypothetical protein CES88_09830 [Halobacteriovorax sp. JY17]